MGNYTTAEGAGTTAALYLEKQLGGERKKL